MLLSNPCKTCLVRATCKYKISDRCDILSNHVEHLKAIHFVMMIITLASYLGCLAAAIKFDGNKIVSLIICLTSIFSLMTTLFSKHINKTMNQTNKWREVSAMENENDS